MALDHTDGGLDPVLFESYDRDYVRARLKTDASADGISVRTDVHVPFSVPLLGGRFFFWVWALSLFCPGIHGTDYFFTKFVSPDSCLSFHFVILDPGHMKQNKI